MCNKTIKCCADQERSRLVARHGQAAFSRMCLAFEKGIMPAGFEETIKKDLGESVYQAVKEKQSELELFAVLKLLGAINLPKDTKLMQLSLVWLDGKGYGKFTLAELGQMFSQLTENLPQ